MVIDPNDKSAKHDERDNKAPIKFVDREDDDNAIYNTPCPLPMTGLEKVEVYPY